MIVAERKNYAELEKAVRGFRRVLVAGCGTCVAVCLAGGEKEAGILAAQLQMSAQLEGKTATFDHACVERQCDAEFLAELGQTLEAYDAVLSLACGAGVQFLAQQYPHKPVLAGLNTDFIGVNCDVGVWEERCRSCGDCVLSLTGGICPVALCPKGMLNGPCGGAIGGKCETDRERECVWSRIHRRLEGLSRLEGIGEYRPPRDYAKVSEPGRLVHPAYERRYESHE